MIPCKKCGSYHVVVYGLGPGRCVIACHRCLNYSKLSETLEEAWDNWERENERPIYEIIKELGAQVPDEEWKKLKQPWQPPWKPGIPEGAEWFAVDPSGHGWYFKDDPYLGEGLDSKLGVVSIWFTDGIWWPAGYFPDVASGAVDWHTTKVKVER